MCSFMDVISMGWSRNYPPKLIFCGKKIHNVNILEKKVFTRVILKKSKIYAIFGLPSSRHHHL